MCHLADEGSGSDMYLCSWFRQIHATRFKYSVICVLFASSLCACSPEQSSSVQKGNEVDLEQIKQDLSYLASDDRNGRKPGTQGFKDAAQYVAERFESIGLKPLPGYSEFCQTVPISQMALEANASTISIGDQAYSAEEGELLIQPDLAALQSHISGEAVFVGFGIHAPEFGLDPFDGLELDGKVVVYLNGFPGGLPGLEGAHLNAQKPADALRRGAIATIELETPASLKRRPWSLIRNFFTQPLTTWVDEDGAGQIALPRSTVRTTGQVSELLFRSADTRLAEVFAAIERGEGVDSFALNQSVEIARRSTTNDFESCNVVGVLEGRAPELKNEYIVFMAHLDHLGVQLGEIHNGALDNALGVSILLEIAGQFAQLKESGPDRSIVFVALTAEENGLIGADYLVRAGRAIEPRAYAAAFNVDMPVLIYPFEDVIVYGEDQSTLGPIAQQAADRIGITVSPDPAPAEAYFTRSDHYSFILQGIPALYVKLGVQGGGEEARADFLANHYHKPSDDLNIAIDWSAAERYVLFHHDMILGAANMPVSPKWLDASIFSQIDPNRPTSMTGE